MGPSGAGKSTLLNILAGYKKKGYTGKVLINEKERCCATERSCYIMQEDNLHPLLTVREIMNMAATLKLGAHHSKKFRSHRVNKILESLNLLPSEDTMTGKLSGGQKKRLVIALELIDNPPVMFFDEPTSGLDSSTTKQCVNLLRDLSHDGRAIICTVHQPSALVFEMFDHLYCLTAGMCCYSGSPSNMKTFLSNIGLYCPEYHNPADYLIEVCGGEFGNHTQVLVDASNNGKSNEWRKYVSWNNSDLSPDEQKTPVKAPLIPPANNDDISKQQTEYTKFHISFCGQVAILVKRTCITLIRDKFHMYCRLVMHLIIGLLIGTFFYGIGNDAGRVYNNFSLLFFSTIFQAFAALQSMVISFPLEVPIIRREYFNRWYSVRAYYLANSLADFPIQIGCSILYCSVVYWMSGQPNEWYRFFMFMFMCAIVALLAQSMGYLIGSSMKVMNGVVFGPLAIMPWVMMSGYFIHMRDSPYWSRPFFKASYFRHGLEGLATSIYGYSRPSLPCVSEDYCHFVSPKKFLKELDMLDVSYLTNVAVISALYAFIKILTYFVLVYQLRHKR
ncbi:hypothetical protein O3M35_007830 [Rhynocoris fuscipes]|uniref:ABC transporter domain-containing protein n=1 Tax=Rhynocoris fuscipes TaxID=488301 RepID=A0AAW1DAX5_9HEMI